MQSPSMSTAAIFLYVPFLHFVMLHLKLHQGWAKMGKEHLFVLSLSRKKEKKPSPLEHRMLLPLVFKGF